jgi:hypothetical protein
MTLIEYMLDPADVSAARLLAIGIRPRLELALFAVAVGILLGWSVSPWKFEMLPLLIGLTASLGAFRMMQIGKVNEAALSAYQRNATLRMPTVASWDENGISIQPAGAAVERIAWIQLQRMLENERIFLLLQPTGVMHAIPKRAFTDPTMLVAFRRLAGRQTGYFRGR